MISKMEKKVLMIAYSFPPKGGSGIQRTLKFVKFLHLYGWISVVLTVKDWGHELRDETLLNEIPEGTKIYRTFSFELIRIYWVIEKRFGKRQNFSPIKDSKNKNGVLRKIKNIIHTFTVPDPAIGWFPFALFSAIRIIKKEKVNCIYSTSAPYTSHLVALLLKKIFGLPWVADFRDLWTQHPFSTSPQNLRMKIEERMEYKVLKTADRIVVATDHIGESFLLKYPAIAKDKFKTITNGYDLDDFRALQPKVFSKFTITYVGSFYSIRTPKYFLQALRMLIDEKPTVRNNMQVLFIGKFDPRNYQLLDDLELQNVVTVYNYVFHQEAVQYMLGSDILLLILPPNAVGVYTGKIFEYIASKRPILALVPEDGSAAKLIKETKSGFIVNPTDVCKIKDCLHELYLKYEKKQLKIFPDFSNFGRFERKRLTGELVSIFTECSKICS